MSAMAPRGPLPTRVYWVRRLLVLGVALAMVFGLAQLLGAGRGQEPERAQVIVGLPSQSSGTPQATPTAAPGHRKKGAKAKAGSPKPTPLAEPSGPCERSDIVATPDVVGTPYAGRPVRFRVALTTRSTPACTWTASATSMVVKVTSGDDRIWSSQDCPEAVPSKPVVVRQEVPAKVTVVWRGQRSDDTCSRQPAWAQPGWYHVEAAAFGGDPTDLQFKLELPVARTVTASPKPEKPQPEDTTLASTEPAPEASASVD
ncbi:hypothetical protein [Nocardioides mesophilus]|uniref:DUF4232 domain-containing protein n=1 Tax=Nocardioides mesophilus TaxID=433659 RepID=A0A7G9R6K6_9ACTN|nr:hypothetical protein [Nocardioides mesophilus]QNN51231.1 hypothetical protein H9L09_11325 [Nocardioides mesophilus]